MSSTPVFHTSGRRWLAQVINKVVSLPANLYLGLRQLDGVSGHPADAAAADTLVSNLQEVSTSGTGYARIAMALGVGNFPDTTSGADALLTGAQETFNFTGAVNGITHGFLATTVDNTGVLIASAPCAAVRNVVSGDQLKETFVLTLTAGA